MTKRRTLFFLFFLLSVFGYAQQRFAPKDTLEVGKLLKAAEKMLRKKTDSSIIYLNKAMEIATRIGYEKGRGYCYVQIGSAYEIKKEFAKAAEYYLASRKVWAKLQDRDSEADALNRLGIMYMAQDDYAKAYIYYKSVLQLEASLRSKGEIVFAYNGLGTADLSRGDYPSALSHYQKALKIAEQIGKETSRAAAYNNIGILYEHQHEDATALEYYLKSLEIKKKLGDKKSIATTLNNIGIIYKRKKNYEKALEFYNAALKFREEIQDKFGVSSTLNNIGLLYQERGEYQQAGEYYARAMKMKIEINDKKGVAHSFLNMSQLALEMKDYPQCIEYGLKCLEVAAAIEANVVQRDATETLYRAYKAKGDMAKSLAYFERHKTILDSLFSVEKAKAIANLEAKATLERKEQELVNLAKDNELNRLNAERKNRELEINKKQAEADRLFALAKQEKDKRKADSLTSLATKHQLEADKLAAENQRTEAEKKAYKAESEKQKEANAFRTKMLMVSLAGLAVVLVLLYSIYRSQRAQKSLNGKLQKANEELRQTQEELITQHDFIEEQNKTLASKNHQITQSITTALAIQTAVLPSDQRIRKIWKDFFVLYQPRDIVSGDFYWAERVGKEVIVAAGDCTGHGVPGAFMSLIAINLLDRVVLQLDIVMPAEIMRKMHELVHHILKQDEIDEQSGMDMGIVRVGAAGEICFAGAKRPLHYIDATAPTKVHTIAGTRKSIGGTQDEWRDFEEVTFFLPLKSAFYMGSDGLADQNNEKRKRLKEEPVLEALLGAYPLSMEAQKRAVQHLLDEHMKGTDQRDDILLLGIKI